MSDKILISGKQAVDLLRLAIRNGTEQAGVDYWSIKLAAEWMDQAQREIQRLRARVAELTVRLGTTACGESMCVQYRDLQAENESLRRDVDVYKDGILAVVNLIENSLGVYGLHLNGELAPWDTLRTDGGYEDWLQSLDAAVDAIDKAREAG